MNIEFVATFFYKIPNQYINVFYDNSTGEVLFIARELAKILEYRCVGVLLRKNPLFSETCHQKLVIGSEIRDLKTYLQSICIERYAVSTKIMFVTESGFHLLMASSCKIKAFYIGEWVCKTVLPQAKPCEKNIYLTRWLSQTFSTEIPLIKINNRIGFFIDSLTTHLRNFHHIDIGYGRYIENIHLQKISIEQNENQFIFYESGLYRYLTGTNHPLGKIFATEYMKKLIPKLRHSQLEWQKLNKNTSKNTDQPKIYHRPQEQFGEWHQQLQKNIIRDSVVVNARLDGFLKFFRDLIPLLEERFANLQHSIEEVKSAVSHNSPIVSTTKWKQLAIRLKIFHIDKETPHTLFVKALVKYAQTEVYEKLCDIVAQKTQGATGENWVQLGAYTYHIWRKERRVDI
ncbi:BRO family protein [Candidatus Uabimicrobium sp. HlEnr_7]|uniref:BRO family protein n=1 Tax=Candidatus Uabimicrobium helgolandensis TaxID=3095367 RepID=UPI003556684D